MCNTWHFVSSGDSWVSLSISLSAPGVLGGGKDTGILPLPGVVASCAELKLSLEVLKKKKKKFFSSVVHIEMKFLDVKL